MLINFCNELTGIVILEKEENRLSTLETEESMFDIKVLRDEFALSISPLNVLKLDEAILFFMVFF
jgi:hypothetical protein